MPDTDRARPVLGERRMSDVEALMWNLEKDPHLASTFANVTFLDRAPDMDRLMRRMAHAVRVVPRLRQRVVAGLGRLAPPEWQDDPNFDLGYHIRRIAVPAPHDERAVFDLAVVLAATPLDRTRPLWEFTVLEGLGGGRAVLFQKIHHTITDGEGGVRMSAEFLDVTREGDDREARTLGDDDDTDAFDIPAAPATNLVDTTLETAGHAVRRGAGQARRAIGASLDLARHPQRLPSIGGEAIASVQSLARQAAVTDRAHSPLWTDRSLRRRFEVLRLPLDDTKRAAKALGGSINDLYVAGAAGAAGAYHRAMGSTVDELRISMPVSTRHDRSMGGNSFTPARVLVPAGIEDPVERFAAVRDRMTATKSERALALAEMFAGLVNVLPTSMLVRFARQQVETVDFAISNVRGAPFDLFVAGAKIEANYPMGPTGGTAFNLTLLSSGGWLDMGVNIDLAAVDDPELLRRCLDDAYAELLAAGA